MHEQKSLKTHYSEEGKTHYWSLRVLREGKEISLVITDKDYDTAEDARDAGLEWVGRRDQARQAHTLDDDDEEEEEPSKTPSE